MPKLMPNCSEFVTRIEMSEKETDYFIRRLDVIFNERLHCEEYFDEYLNLIPGQEMFIGSEDEKILAIIIAEIKLMRKIKSGGVEL